MLQRAFLVTLGFLAPAALAGGAALGGCGSVVTVSPPGGTGGRHGGEHFPDGGGGMGGSVADAQIDYVDPGCPDAGPPLTMFTCDPFNQHNGDCPSNEGCYIFSTPPETTCGQEVYGATCAPQGQGQQGAPCGGGSGCAAGFSCVVTGSGDQCVRLCELQGASSCPPGLVCETIDVKGFGGCL
jgi:hypothetical protein